VIKIGKYRVYAEFQYKGRKIRPQKTAILSSGKNAFTFQIRTKKGKWLNAFHIWEKDYSSAKKKAKEYMNKHSKELYLKDK